MLHDPEYVWEVFKFCRIATVKNTKLLKYPWSTLTGPRWLPCGLWIVGVPGSGRIPPTVSLQARSVPIQEGQAAADFRDPIDFQMMLRVVCIQIYV